MSIRTKGVNPINRKPGQSFFRGLTTQNDSLNVMARYPNLSLMQLQWAICRRARIVPYGDNYRMDDKIPKKKKNLVGCV